MVELLGSDGATLLFRLNVFLPWHLFISSSNRCKQSFCHLVWSVQEVFVSQGATTSQEVENGSVCGKNGIYCLHDLMAHVEQLAHRRIVYWMANVAAIGAEGHIGYAPGIGPRDWVVQLGSQSLTSWSYQHRQYLWLFFY